MIAPAPWRKEHLTGWIMPYVILDDNGYHVAACNEVANANTIAAVPDLVAALQDVERELDNWHKWKLQTSPSYGTSQSCAHTEIRLRAARAALEKAGVKG